jgi:hypothetical protein
MFSEIRMKPHRQDLAKEAILKADTNLLGQMILVAKNKKLQMNDVVAHHPGAFVMGIC